MNIDFHYYGTYCAARLAGYTPEDAKTIAYYAQFVDECSQDILKKYKCNTEAATVQSDGELRWAMLPKAYTTDEIHNVTSIWSPFHFLPANFGLEKKYTGKKVNDEIIEEMKLLCQPNSELLEETVNWAVENPNMAKTGMVMHILADTWAHCWYAGTPAKHVNDAVEDVYEIRDGKRVKLSFYYDPIFSDKIDKGHYSCGSRAPREKGLMYLGHSRMGHLPDYGFMTYEYKPVWSDREMTKFNPEDYMNAFKQMVYAMQCIMSGTPFCFGVYGNLRDKDEEDVQKCIRTRKLDASAEWKELGKKLCGTELPPFDKKACFEEHKRTAGRGATLLQAFLAAALEHKARVRARANENEVGLLG